MMTYEEIITEADERYPNGFSVTSKLRKLYNLETKLMRTIYRIKTATKYDILSGQFLYPLEFHHSKIISVVWEGVSISYEEINPDDASPPFYYTYENSLGRHPTPDKDVEGGLVIFHYSEPRKVTESNYGGLYPSFDPDFPMVLVFGLCRDMAESNREYDISRDYKSKYDEEVRDFKKANPEPEIPPMRVVD